MKNATGFMNTQSAERSVVGNRDNGSFADSVFHLYVKQEGTDNNKQR